MASMWAGCPMAGASPRVHSRATVSTCRQPFPISFGFRSGGLLSVSRTHANGICLQGSARQILQLPQPLLEATKLNTVECTATTRHARQMGKWGSDWARSRAHGSLQRG